MVKKILKESLSIDDTSFAIVGTGPQPEC